MIGRKNAHFIAATMNCFLLVFAISTVSMRNVMAGSADEQEKQVREFVAAFNARNLDKMLELADDNIQWLSVDGAKIAIETDGKKALRESMEKYFRSCPSCKSSLAWVSVAGSRVTAKEKASWTSKSGPKAQSSLSVYEFQNGKILRVYYFPAETEAKK